MTETISASDVLTWSQSVDGYSGALVLSNSGALIDSDGSLKDSESKAFTTTMILKFVNALVGSVDETKTPLKRVQVCFGDEAHFVITKIGMFFVVVEKKPQLEIEEPEESDAE